MFANFLRCSAVCGQNVGGAVWAQCSIRVPATSLVHDVYEACFYVSKLSFVKIYAEN